MKESIRKDILDILRDSIRAIKRDDIVQLRELSDHTLHSSTIYQEEETTAIAVLIYSLFKIYEKQGLRNDNEWPNFNANVLKLLENAYESFIKADVAQYRINIKKLFESISKFEKSFGKFVTEVIENSKIKKGEKLIEHGLSIGRTAEMLGISRWDLMSYLGVTDYAEKEPETITVKDRLKAAERLFR